MRTVIVLALVLIAAACSNPSKADPAPTPDRNLVCERVAVISPKAKCSPELSGVGELATHTARVAFEVTTEDKKTGTRVVVCGLNAGQLGMVCDELERKPEPKPTAPAAPAAAPAQQPEPAKVEAAPAKAAK